jgi:hypothetical protein
VNRGVDRRLGSDTKFDVAPVNRGKKKAIKRKKKQKLRKG